MAMSFGLKWMEGGVFTSFIYVFVNGSPTGDFKVLRGFRQGDPLSPFLFAIVVERLEVVVRRATDLGVLNGFQVNDSMSYNLMQFDDDTVLVYDGS